MRKHRLDRRQRKKQRKIIIFSMIGIVCLFSAGYAAFSSNFLVSGKGTIIEKPSLIEDLKLKKVTSGDGLYEDAYEEGRYIYRGTNPDNYISFNDELWRIISIENDNTLKIISPSIGDMAWDSIDNRNNNENTYCNHELTYMGTKKYWGCNMWEKQIGEYNDGVYSGTVSTGATLNTYLNTTYYSTLSESKKYIQNHDFYVGKISLDVETDGIYALEKEAIWNGNIGLMNVSDFLKASTNSECNSFDSSRSPSSPCSLENGNYLDELKEETWTIDSYKDLPFSVRTVSVHADINGNLITGGISGYGSFAMYQVRPVIYLKSNISLKGEVTSSSPYTIES